MEKKFITYFSGDETDKEANYIICCMRTRVECKDEKVNAYTGIYTENKTIITQ